MFRRTAVALAEDCVVAGGTTTLFMKWMEDSSLQSVSEAALPITAGATGVIVGSFVFALKAAHAWDRIPGIKKLNTYLEIFVSSAVTAAATSYFGAASIAAYVGGLGCGVAAAKTTSCLVSSFHGAFFSRRASHIAVQVQQPPAVPLRHISVQNV